MKKASIGMGVFAALLMMGWTVSAVPVVTEDFGGGDNGFVLSGNPTTTGGNYGSHSSGGGYFNVNVDSSGDVQPRTDYVFDNNTPGTFAGDYTAGGLAANGIKGISFNFYNPGATAIPEMQVYLIANKGTANERIWYHPGADVAGSSGWANYGANLSYDSLNAGTGEWFTTGGDDLATWQSDLAHISGIGFRMLYLTNYPNNQQYGFDDIIIQDDPYILLVPEPQTYAMLGFAFLSLGVTFRRKLEDGLASLKAMLA